MATSIAPLNIELPPEDRANQLLSRLLPDLSKPPVPLNEIAERLNIGVVVTALSPGVSGALIRDRGRCFIAVNTGHHRNRQRFTIAHEIGHFELEHGMDDHLDKEFTVIMRNENSSSAENTNEVAANQFAAALLMPRELIMRDFVRIGAAGDEMITRLALKYQVSELAMQLRLRNLGLLQPF
ncbi:MAG: ImmA/IrrE family metallo-endopeptidase [Terracidiphilus sp.]